MDFFKINALPNKGEGEKKGIKEKKIRTKCTSPNIHNFHMFQQQI